MELGRALVKRLIVSDDLVLEVQETLEKDLLFLNVKYKKGKFTIDKRFQNSLIGREEIKKAFDSLDTEEKVKKHFGLK